MIVAKTIIWAQWVEDENVECELEPGDLSRRWRRPDVRGSCPSSSVLVIALLSAWKRDNSRKHPSIWEKTQRAICRSPSTVERVAGNRILTGRAAATRGPLPARRLSHSEQDTGDRRLLCLLEGKIRMQQRRNKKNSSVAEAVEEKCSKTSCSSNFWHSQAALMMVAGSPPTEWRRCADRLSPVALLRWWLPFTSIFIKCPSVSGTDLIVSERVEIKRSCRVIDFTHTLKHTCSRVRKSVDSTQKVPGCYQPLGHCHSNIYDGPIVKAKLNLVSESHRFGFRQLRHPLTFRKRTDKISAIIMWPTWLAVGDLRLLRNINSHGGWTPVSSVCSTRVMGCWSFVPEALIDGSGQKERKSKCSKPSILPVQWHHLVRRGV